MHRSRPFRLGLSLVGSLLAAFPTDAQCEAAPAHLVPPGASYGSASGYRVSVSGPVAVLAAVYDDVLGADSGAAYVFEREHAGGWSFRQRLTASDGTPGDAFGWSVVVDGKTIVVGAPGADAAGAADRGAAYVFARAGDHWREIAKLEPDGLGAGARFGFSAALADDELLIGAPHLSLAVPGAAALYRRDATGAWHPAADFAPSDPDFSLGFGYEVALGRELLLVTGGSGAPPFGSDAIYVYERAAGAGAFRETGRIVSPNGGGQGIDLFANDIALHGDLLVATAPGELDFETGIYGALYVFQREPAGGEPFRLLRRVASENATDGLFLPEAVSVAGDWLVAGTPTARRGAFDDAGTVHVFGRHVGGRDAFGEVTRLFAAEAHEDAYFGLELALAGDTLLVGAPDEYPVGHGTGSGWVFDLSLLARARWRNDAGGANPSVYDAGRPLLGGTFEARVDVAASGRAFARLFAFDGPAEIPLRSGAVLLAADAGGNGELLGLSALAGPLAVYALAIPPDASLCGLSIATQALLFGGGRPFALSNAQDLVVGAF